MIRQRVLFVCIHNSARSQMAEELLRHIAGDRFDVYSAGLEPGNLNPLAVDVLREIGIDIAGKKPVGVFEFIKKGILFSHVITVCDESSAERCPVFPGVTNRLHWSFPDPATFTGSYEERLARTRMVRDSIVDRIRTWIGENAISKECAK